MMSPFFHPYLTPSLHLSHHCALLFFLCLCFCSPSAASFHRLNLIEFFTRLHPHFIHPISSFELFSGLLLLSADGFPPALMINAKEEKIYISLPQVHDIIWMIFQQ